MTCRSSRRRSGWRSRLRRRCLAFTFWLCGDVSPISHSPRRLWRARLRQRRQRRCLPQIAKRRLPTYRRRVSFNIATREGSAALAREAGRHVDCFTCGNAFPSDELARDHGIAVDHPEPDSDDGAGVVLLGLVCPSCMFSSAQGLSAAMRANAARLARVAAYLNVLADSPEQIRPPNAE